MSELEVDSIIRVAFFFNMVIASQELCAEEAGIKLDDEDTYINYSKGGCENRLTRGQIKEFIDSAKKLRKEHE